MLITWNFFTFHCRGQSDGHRLWLQVHWDLGRHKPQRGWAARRTLVPDTVKVGESWKIQVSKRRIQRLSDLTEIFFLYRDLFRKRSYRKSKRRACSPLSGACLSGGNGGTNPSSPVSNSLSQFPDAIISQPGSAQSSPRKYRGSRTSASLKVKGLLGRVWARDSKSKSCENLHVL